MTVRKYSTVSLETTLASSINSVVTSATVATGTGTTLLGGITLTAGDIFICAIDPDTSSEEIVYITARSGDILTITRGQAGTTAISHATGATIQHVFTGEDAQHFEDQTNAAVYPTATQTLTNKTLTSPIISTIVNTGTLTLPTSTDTLVGRATSDTLSNKVLLSPEERTTVSATAATGTVNFDASTQSILYYTTNATANWTLNVRGSSTTTLSSILPVGDSITVTFLATQGATAYYGNTFQIDGSTVVPKWQAGISPTAGNASSVDAYVFNIVKTAATPTYTVFASQTRFA
jgi:hypothetical protein